MWNGFDANLLNDTVVLWHNNFLREQCTCAGTVQYYNSTVLSCTVRVILCALGTGMIISEPTEWAMRSAQHSYFCIPVQYRTVVYSKPCTVLPVPVAHCTRNVLHRNLCSYCVESQSLCLFYRDGRNARLRYSTGTVLTVNARFLLLSL